LISDDYRDYSCAFEAHAPTLYRVQRSTLGAIFGIELVTAMDAVEASLRVVSAVPSLRVIM
jgi:hypothetical protein